MLATLIGLALQAKSQKVLDYVYVQECSDQKVSAVTIFILFL